MLQHCHDRWRGQHAECPTVPPRTVELDAPISEPRRRAAAQGCTPHPLRMCSSRFPCRARIRRIRTDHSAKRSLRDLAQGGNLSMHQTESPPCPPSSVRGLRDLPFVPRGDPGPRQACACTAQARTPGGMQFVGCTCLTWIVTGSEVDETDGRTHGSRQHHASPIDWSLGECPS